MTTNVDRLLPDGSTDPKEVVNQSQCYITSAGYKNSFSYDKLIELLISSVIFPDEYITLGGDYKLAILEGAVKEDMIDEMKMNGTYNEASFDREFGSIWAGGTEDAYFNVETFEKNRILLQPEYEYSGRSSKNAYYIIGADIGRKGCNSEACVVKVTPQPQGASIKTLVNIYSKNDATMEEQAIWLKNLYFKYKARTLVIDANGIGINLIDEMVKANIDPESGDTLRPFGVEGGTYEDAGQEYKRFRTDDMEKDALYLIKGNAPVNTEAHSYLQTQLSSGKIKFLIDEQTAKAKLLQTKVGQNMTPDERNKYLLPFEQTSILKEQLANLIESNEGVNVILKQNNRGIPKDKFSALEYTMLYIKKEEERKKKRKTHSIARLMFVN